MSEAKKTPTAETSAGEDHVPELDISKLHALPTEQQDLYLLTFVSDLRQFVGGSTADQLPARQPAIKKENDSRLYHCSAPPPVVIELIVGVEDDSKMNKGFKGQPIQHSTPLRKPGGELHMIIERERNSVENDHQSSKDVDHGHHSNKPKE